MLVPGPSTPVTTRDASGNILLSMSMSGMVPPMPACAISFPSKLAAQAF